jgi:hypothetical protein
MTDTGYDSGGTGNGNRIGAVTENCLVLGNKMCSPSISVYLIHFPLFHSDFHYFQFVFLSCMSVNSLS